MSRLLRLGALSIVVVLVASAAGCGTVKFYWQAVDGQIELIRKSRPIGEVLDDAAVAREVKLKLERVREIRDFASRQLGLPDNASYRRYADLRRRFVVWNVFAADEFSVRAKEWCFPIAGCVGYRGYFHEADARRFAQAECTKGIDVYVGGVPAYSTLGWLDDPVLNTFIHYPETELARLIFHELSHQVAYAKGDSTFNESFAVAVETEGVERWLATHGDAAQRDAYFAAQRRKADFLALVERTRQRLAQVYAAGGDATAMRAAKAATIDDMRREYGAMKASWGGFTGYDWWFAEPINNAQIASVAIYTQLVDRFAALLAQEGGDLPRFYARVKALAKRPESERRAALEVLPERH